MDRPVAKANRKLEAAFQEQYKIIFLCSAVALWKEYGWRQLRITRRFSTCMDLMQECSNHGTQKSMLQMLEDETGIELRLSGYEKSFHNLAYLDVDKWDGKPPTRMQLLYMRTQQARWIGPQLLACLCLSMYRDEHWGADRIAKFIQAVDEVRNYVCCDRKKAVALFEKEAGIKAADILPERNEENDCK